MVKYCNDTSVCLSVSVSVREHISRTICAIFANFSVHVAYGRGSVILQQGDEIQRGRGSFGGFLPHLTMHCNAFAAKGLFDCQ